MVTLTSMVLLMVMITLMVIISLKTNKFKVRLKSVWLIISRNSGYKPSEMALFGPYEDSVFNYVFWVYLTNKLPQNRFILL